MRPVDSVKKGAYSEDTMAHMITIPTDLYRKADALSARDRRSITDVVTELMELGWHAKENGIDLEWLRMEQEADEDIAAGRVSPAYTDGAGLQGALDALKGN